MLPVQNRLKKRDEFAKVFSKGAYVASENIAIKYSNNFLPVVRIGFPVGKNYSKKAVERNHARRILRAACMTELQNLRPGYDIILMIKPAKKNIEFNAIIFEIKQIFIKARLLSK
jgi:ribonuclease P protein component